MKGTSSTVTTHKIIKAYVDERIINETKDKANSQIHHLTINDKNAFNISDKQLSEIDELIDRMHEPTRKIYVAKDDDINDEEFELYSNFLFLYRNTVNMMLQFWLGQVNSRVQSEDSRQQFYTRIIKLMQKLTLQYYNMANSKQYYRSYLKGQISVLLDVKYELPSPNRTNIIDEDLVDNLIDKIWVFEKQFATVD